MPVLTAQKQDVVTIVAFGGVRTSTLAAHWAATERALEAWRAAHGRLYEHLRDSVPYWPEGVNGLQPLYQAVVHDCLAGRTQETCRRVYCDRTDRGTSGPYRFTA